MKSLKKRYIIKAPAEEIYTALTNPFTIELWTGYRAEMEEKAGTEFSMWDGDICGRNILFEKNKRIKQQWYFGEQEEESIVEIKLHAEKPEKTSVELIHTNIPDDVFDEILEGWDESYFGALKEFFE